MRAVIMGHQDINWLAEKYSRLKERVGKSDAGMETKLNKNEIEKKIEV